MNSTADNIIFDSNGQCNYCKNFMKKNQSFKKNHNLEKLIKKLNRRIKFINMIVFLDYLEVLIAVIL